CARDEDPSIFDHW
nr:immunoglobulin heavy chain junction region [Macaca mulatta]MOX63928.1 immunoglobulin heavy chain junction region [Macaca mulatta]MOX66009.1 immunoglobulin heavy chain junction region [Macaca mulatta]MOX68725.1 immunoglobulin heavy chain junction region [Macaca mulatta]MOX68733.1 immunoglobulin heavy chain junction region [Macaca mulatta]